MWSLSLPDGKATPFGGVQSTNATSAAAVFSPDGRWVAYTSSDGGRPAIYVQPFPATGATYELSDKNSDGPHHPVWSPDGKELFYIPRPGTFESVGIMTQPTFAFGNPQVVPSPFVMGPATVRRAFDMTPDGRFLGLTIGGGGATGSAAQIQVVLNWFEELKARVPSRP